MCGWVGLWLTPRERIDYPPGKREKGGGVGEEGAVWEKEEGKEKRQEGGRVRGRCGGEGGWKERKEKEMKRR